MQTHLQMRFVTIQPSCDGYSGKRRSLIAPTLE
jgi:hypothetical protein